MVGLEQPKPNARGVGVRRSLAAVSQGSASHAEAGSLDLYRSRVVHCNCHENREETDEEIIKAISSDYLVCKFEDDALNCDKNDILSRVNYVDFNRTYITKHIDAGIRVWEVCGRVTDMEDAVIPHAYYVRHIGSLIEITERGDQKDA